MNFERTARYMAPEVLCKYGITEKVDVYSMGIILWELVTRDIPFFHHESHDEFVKCICFQGERPEIPSWCPRRFQKIMLASWQKDPKCRPSMEELVFLFEDCIKECEKFDFSNEIEKLITDKTGLEFWKKYFPDKVKKTESILFSFFFLMCILVF